MAAAKVRALIWGLALLTGTGALASPLPNNSHLGSPLRYPGQPNPPHDERTSPYAMSYAEEAAQSLGVRNGHMDLFSSQPVRGNPYIPTFSGGLGGDGAMLRLQWHPGD